MWHANPKIYLENDRPNPFNNLTAKQIWDKDNKKKIFAENKGFSLIYVWESDVIENRESELLKCKHFIKGTK